MQAAISEPEQRRCILDSIPFRQQDDEERF